MIPIPASIPLQFVLRHWRVIAGAVAAIALGLFLWVKVNAYGDRREAEGIALERAVWEDKEARATAAHEAKIEQLNEEHKNALTDLQGQLAAAMARPAARTIRVPVSAVCPAASPTDAGLPQSDPGDGLLTIDDPGYGPFRDWLYQYAAGPAPRG